MNKILLALIGIVYILGYSSCDDGNSTTTEPVAPDFSGNWSLQSDSDINIGIQNIAGQPENRIIICDLSSSGDGCLPGIMLDENTVELDDSKYGLLTLSIEGSTLKIIAANQTNYNFTGLYNSVNNWPDESCGLESLANNQIGIIEDDCIIGAWYTLLTDPFGGPSIILNKSYFSNGTGQVDIPDENKTYTFSWKVTNSVTGELLSEFSYSDPTIEDAEYTFECTGSGLALGGAESYIRINESCLL